LFAYPPAGRSPAQQGQDKYECHQWAVEQSKFDPVQMAAQVPVQPGQQGRQSAGNTKASEKSAGTVASVLGGAAQGAAIGAVSDGDVEKSAAAGAAAGLQQSYGRARATCFRARGYRVSDG
jgi:hypothetical protein